MLIPKYTEVLKNLMDNEQTAPLLEKALSTYPMYEPVNSKNYSVIPTRSQLNQKLLNHYKYREIGFETVGRFLDELEIAMCEVMPYYYSLYRSADIMNAIDDPFGNVDIVEKTVESSEGETEANVTNTSEAKSSTESNTNLTSYNKQASSTEPQSEITTPAESIDNLSHADTMNWSKDSNSSGGNTSSDSESSSENVSKGTSKNDREMTYTKKGNQGVNTYAHDMIELRTVFLNIEKMIIEDKRISDLFMKVW